ncbi:MAG: LamG domain-containing protein, partial [Myxococcota bacterium]|nr:LamG domain-containing protein [Myxococcota bacterium]
MLADFPVSILLDDADLAARARPDGNDIHFATLDGDALPHELVSYAGGKLEAWVKVTLAGPTTIELRYGGDVVTYPRSEVWLPRAEAVWHVAETADTLDDSTERHPLRALTATRNPVVVPGMIGNGRAFTDPADLAMRHAMCAPDIDVIMLGTESFAYSAWLEIASLPPGDGGNNYDQPFHTGGIVDGSAGFALQLTQNSLDANVGDGTMHAYLPFKQLPLGTWAHYAAIVDRPGTTLNTFVDGVLTNSLSLAAAIPPASEITTARRICLGGTLSGYSGAIDEVRVYRGVVTPAWIDAEVDNVKDRASFVVLGTEVRD